MPDLTEANYNTQHYLVLAKVRTGLAVSKRPAQKMDMKTFNLKKLNEKEVKNIF
jgi:hypothetical protein